MNIAALVAARARAQTKWLEAQASGDATKIQNALQNLAEASAALDAALEANSPVAGAPGAPPQLIARARAEGGVAAIVSAALDGRAAGGAIGELQAETGAGAGDIPLDLLLNPQNAVTPAPATVGAQQPAPVMPIFATGLMAYLGIQQIRVASGNLVFPTLTTRPTVGRKANDNSDAIAETTGAFMVSELKPQRLQAGFSFRRTEAAQLRGLDQSLSAALNAGLSEELDAYTYDQATSQVMAANSAAELTFETWRSTVYGLVDGRHAQSVRDIRLVTGPSAYAHAASKYTTNGDRSALASLEADGVPMRVSPHVADTANMRQSVLARLGMAPDAVMAMWPSISLIRDEVTRAAEGEIKLTAVMLASFQVTRTDGFKHIGAQIEA